MREEPLEVELEAKKTVSNFHLTDFLWPIKVVANNEHGSYIGHSIFKIFKQVNHSICWQIEQSSTITNLCFFDSLLNFL